MTLDQLLQLAVNEHRAGRVERAQRLYRCVLAIMPAHFVALVQFARLQERPGRWSEALALYDRAIRINPGHALPSTRRSLLLLRSVLGPPPTPRPAPVAGTRRVTMTSLGANGRFGNQILQYGFLRLYGETHGLSVEAPDWIGRDLFGFDDPMPGTPLPGVGEDRADLVGSLVGEAPDVHADADLWGYFCGPTGRWSRHRARFRTLFQFRGSVAAIADAALARLDLRDATLVALHLRRGDFISGGHWIPPNAWYRDWLDAIWPTLANPRLYIASDDPAVMADFAAFSPATAADIGEPLPGAEFLVDFHVLRHARLLAISNSSFSFTAAMLSAGGDTFMRPDEDCGRLVAFDPWNAPVLLK